MDNWIISIFMSVVAATLFEVIKFITNFIISRRYTLSIPFSIKGYWCSYHEQMDTESKILYKAYELIKMNVYKDKLIFHLYQYTEDGRFHSYNGCGYCRYNKISLSYEEIGDEISNQTGTFNLFIENSANHTVILTGFYSEFPKNNKKLHKYPYSLHSYKMNKKDIFCSLIFRESYIKKIMLGKEFQNECKYM